MFPTSIPDLHYLSLSFVKFYGQLEIDGAMFALIFCSVVFVAAFVFVFSFFIYSRLGKIELRQHRRQPRNLNELGAFKLSHTFADEGSNARENFPADWSHSLLLEILPHDSTKCASLFCAEGRDNTETKKVGDTGEEQIGKKKKKKKNKKKRAKNKRSNLSAEDHGCGEKENSCTELDSHGKQDLICFYPFTSACSATQRKIKQQYDELMKCHESRGLTLAQVGQFTNCLINARNELQHKADSIQRKFTITKALLLKADRSCFDRLHQQICKLELEQKRLEEDAFVYNWLQQQLILSPAYRQMLQIGASMELKVESDSTKDAEESEFSDISFEELLAQEKKDSFWSVIALQKKNGKLRSCSR